MKVFVLGHRGMLGHVLVSYLRERGLEVLTTNHRFAVEPRNPLIRAVIESQAEWVINAIGKIKQKTSDRFELLETNSLLPVQLKSYLHPAMRLLHASTDCVFSGHSGNYRRCDPRDAEDDYGLSKVLGEVIAERNRCQVIRTSIIGPELTGASGLLAWFLAQKAKVNGYADHFWNGITTLEWAKIAFEIIDGTLRPTEPLVQAASANSLSKFQLLQLISRIWKHSIPVERVETGAVIDRTLVPDIQRSPVEQQLEELHAWYQHRNPSLQCGD